MEIGLVSDVNTYYDYFVGTLTFWHLEFWQVWLSLIGILYIQGRSRTQFPASPVSVILLLASRVMGTITAGASNMCRVLVLCAAIAIARMNAPVSATWLAGRCYCTRCIPHARAQSRSSALRSLVQESRAQYTCRCRWGCVGTRHQMATLSVNRGSMAQIVIVVNAPTTFGTPSPFR